MSENSNSLTEPMSSYPFPGEYDRIEQLRDNNEKGEYVSQGTAKISKDGGILDSEGFGKCSTLIIQNEGSSEAFLAHIDDWRMNDKQYGELDKLSSGKYKAVFIMGTVSRQNSKSVVDPKGALFMSIFTSNGKRQIEIREDIHIDSGKPHWGVSYDPKERKIKTFTRNDHRVREYKLE